jgi:hypothetical protein
MDTNTSHPQSNKPLWDLISLSDTETLCKKISFIGINHIYWSRSQSIQEFKPHAGILFTCYPLSQNNTVVGINNVTIQDYPDDALILHLTRDGLRLTSIGYIKKNSVWTQISIPLTVDRDHILNILIVAHYQGQFYTFEHNTASILPMVGNPKVDPMIKLAARWDGFTFTSCEAFMTCLTGKTEGQLMHTVKFPKPSNLKRLQTTWPKQYDFMTQIPNFHSQRDWRKLKTEFAGLHSILDLSTRIMYTQTKPTIQKTLSEITHTTREQVFLQTLRKHLMLK